MVKFIKQNKVVVLLNGRYAGKKAVVEPDPPLETPSLKLAFERFATTRELLIVELFIYGITNIHGLEINIFSLGSKERGYGHAIVAGIERYPLKITKNMGKKRVAKRSKVKPFIKVVNYNHMMPTRYGLELENLKSVLTVDSFKEPSQREEAKKAIKKLFEERYNSGKNKWFFSKLRF
ncbi:hypothetical protein BGZ72_008269 [Mortierella alpina]|nr:hypothetical protein BGZ72_008269 [Mortierella alpina]